MPSAYPDIGALPIPGRARVEIRPSAVLGLAAMESSAYRDTFARDRLPPAQLWPTINLTSNPHLEYPARLNCAVELLDRMVKQGHGSSPAIHSLDGTWTYSELEAKSNQIAHVLTTDLGLVPGQRVLLRGPNTAMMAACWFGVLKAGGICVTTMPLLRAKELSFTVARAEIEHALCDSQCAADMEETRKQCARLKHTVYFGSSDTSGLEARMAKHPTSFQAVDSSAQDIAIIAFTSGTTGRAKATMHTHRDILTICDIFPRETFKPSAKDVFCGTPPFAFTFGLGGLLLFPLRVGASVALIEKPAPDELLKAIEKFKCTVCFSSPTGYRGMLPALERYNVKTLRACISAGETLPLPTFEAWHKATGLKLIDGIGATEMLHIFISAPPEQIRPGSTGKPLLGYEARVVDNDGKPVPPNTVGLLAVRGPTGCRYMDDTERQKEYVRDGWNYTGDAYLIDDDGYFWYQARADDMIISSGYNIAGPEVENCLLSHPKVKECGVVAAPDPERGFIPKAYIVLHDPGQAGEITIKELQVFVKEQIAPYKYPRAVEFVTSLPRTETGKLQRFKLREEARRPVGA